MSVKSETLVILYLLKLIFPKLNKYLLIIFMLFKYILRDRSFKPKKIQLRSVPVDVFNNILSKTKNKRDLSKSLVVSKRTFIRLFIENIFYYDNDTLWVSVTCEKSNYQNSNLAHNSSRSNCSSIRRKIVQVLHHDSAPHNVVICSNVEENNFRRLFNTDSRQEDVYINFWSINNLQFVPKVADSVLVHLINNIVDMPNDTVAKILNDHFDKPKLVCLNDIFEVLLNEIYFDKSEINSNKLYFKCSAIYSEHSMLYTNNSIAAVYYIVKGVTELKIGSNVNSDLPMEKYIISKDEDSNNLTESIPYSLKYNFDEMKKCLLPYLIGSLAAILRDTVSELIAPIFLLRGSLGAGQHQLVNSLANHYGFHNLNIDCNLILCSTTKQTEKKLNSFLQKAKLLAPVVVSLDNFEVLTSEEEDSRLIDYFIDTIMALCENYTKYPIVFIAITNKKELHSKLSRVFISNNDLSILDVKNNYETLKWYSSAMKIKYKLNNGKILNCFSKNNLIDSDKVVKEDFNNLLNRLSNKIDGYTISDIDNFIHLALRSSFVEQTSESLRPDIHLISEKNFNTSYDLLQELRCQHIDKPKIPKVYWNDIGSLQELKKELLKTIELPLKCSHLFKSSLLQRSGLLLYGPPGCGKTLVAKALSTELNINFMSIKGPELLNMYIGQSEENVRNVFEAARSTSPCLVFLDELDSLAPRRGATGDSGGASDRVVSQLLAEIDGVKTNDRSKLKSVFIMGATNRPDLLDQSLLRPGRLDKLIYVGPYVGVEEKTNVLKAICRKIKLSKDIDLSSVASMLPSKCTGADLSQIVAEAKSSAVRKILALATEGSKLDLKNENIVITREDLNYGVSKYKPSITNEEFIYYENLQKQM